MKKIIFLIFVIIVLACTLSKAQAYRWFEEERTIDNRFFLHVNLKSGDDRLFPIVLNYETFFRMEEIPDGTKVEIYRSLTGKWEDISWDLSQGELVDIIAVDDVCPLLEAGEYIFKTINISSGEDVTFVFGPKKPKEELIQI